MADILRENEVFVRGGMAVHLLRARSKIPAANGWADAPILTFEQLREDDLGNQNVGVRLGKWSKVADLFLHVIDVDVRDSSSKVEAFSNLAALFPDVDFETVPTVQSGSGGASRHFYLLCDRPFPSKKLAHSSKEKTGKDGKKHWTWEIELYGTGKQVVLPPSIHPDTGKPYKWIRRFDLSEARLGLGPEVPAVLLERLTGDRAESGEIGFEVPQPLGMTLDEARTILEDLPKDGYREDREGWLNVGMALHHEFDASPEAFKLWCEFSSPSEKFDSRDQRRVWKSFRAKPKMLRMATLRTAAREQRITRAFEAMDDEAEEASEEHTQQLANGAGPPPTTKADRTDLLLDETPEQASDSKNWRDDLEREDNKNRDVKSTLANVAKIIQNDPRFKGVVEHNAFTQETVTRKPLRTRSPLIAKLTIADPINGDLWGDLQDAHVRAIIEGPWGDGYGLKVPARDLSDAIDIAAAKHPFHPVRDYLNGLTWDGKPRVENLFVKYLGSPDNAYTRDVARLVMLGAVVRVFEPGHKFDFVLIIEGAQGKRKSTFISILAKSWFVEIEGDWGDTKAMVEKFQGHWICEISELSGFSKAEVQQIKGAISRVSDTVRLAYAHRAKDYPRQCIFIGSTNEIDYLRDSTGGRRFWPIVCTTDEIDTDGLKGEIDQYWAEAVAVYRAMRERQPHGMLPLFLRDEAVRIEAEHMQESRRVEMAEDWMTDEITKWLDEEIDEHTLTANGIDDLEPARMCRRSETSLIECWLHALNRRKEDYNETAARLTGRAMKAVPGWSITVGVRSTKYGRQKVYRRLDALRFPYEYVDPLADL